MKGEEFFGEVKEERLIDKDLSWLLFFGVVFMLCFSVFVYQHRTIRIESFWTWSYWLEVMGFSLIIGDLFFEERTKELLSVGEGYFTPGHANWMGWWKFASYILTYGALVSCVLYFLVIPQGLIGIRQWFELCVFVGLGYSIGYGPYFYVLDKTNDRILGTGVGLATAGLTFATSAQITTTFF